MMEITTIAEAKQYILDNIEEGVECPACTRNVQMQKFNLDHNMASALRILDEHTNQGEYVRTIALFNEYADTESNLNNGGNWTKVKHWGLIESEMTITEEGGSQGNWRITQKGRDFVHGKVKVSKKAKTFKDKLHGYLGDPILITDIKIKPFDYVNTVGHTYKGIGEREEKKGDQTNLFD